MVHFGQVRKQKTSFFGRPQNSGSYIFNRFNPRMGSVDYLPPVEPKEHPLLQNAETFLKASYGDTDAVQLMAELGYIHDTELSNVETNVYVRDGKPLILHRGSSNAKDFLVSDVLLAINKSAFDPRVWSATKITRLAQEKYNAIADHVGHSWGGSLSEMVADKNAFILTYNKGASYYHLNKAISPRQLDIRTKGDLVSLLSKFQNRNVITIDNKGKGFLAAHNLNNLD